ncbi:V-set and immunoglobulin domain-containing protein 10-like isoform X2 [Centropristis striata]|uniref:V-set and immunoglobulin domain-containing protein 10-like isoform X2 n=1 Tax=Centropristis striata TaxID=184440 RepID=UPI0027E01088|nr:V-set and immunoglobulin domain-containing protein 10-like isoform X2 [Centropristis striata]
MTSPDEFGRFISVFLAVSLSSTFQGASSELLVSPAGPTLVNVFSGSNVTLAVTFSGASDPVVTWSMGDLPVVTWTIGSDIPPVVAQNTREVLRIESGGSLTFVNVPLNYSSRYTVEMTKSGLGKSSTTFTLNVFENIQNVVLTLQPDLAKEGPDPFTLQYSMDQGTVEQKTWFFNDVEINSNSHYSVQTERLVVLQPNRSDTGRYTVTLRNPISSVATHIDVNVLYGPDEPVLEASPARPFYVSGASLNVSCQADGFPRPAAEWLFDGQTVSDSSVLNLTRVQTSQGGVYTCRLTNQLTNEQRQKSITLNIYERPSGSPTCSVQSVNDVDLQYSCGWSGGTPPAQLTFPALSNSSSGAGNFSLTFNSSNNLDGKTVICMADHPIEQNRCNVTARSPVRFLPTVRTTVDTEGKIVVTMQCVSEAVPQAVVSWFEGSEALSSGTTPQFEIRDSNVTNFLLKNYSCTCRNPLGSQRREIQLRGPSISDSSLFKNPNGTIITLTWEVPSTSIVTGFDIQLKGPDLLSEDTKNIGRSSVFRTIQVRPGSARSADVLYLDPKLKYLFRIIPKALQEKGNPSEVHRTGPGGGLSGPAIAGIAAGIPCSLLFLLLLAGSVYLCFSWNKNRSRQTRYPGPRATEKATTTPNNLLTGGLRSLPDYTLHETPSEKSMPVPTFHPPPPVRVATRV